MVPEVGIPLSEECLQAASDEGDCDGRAVGIEHIGRRLARYGAAHHRALLMADYAASQREVKIAHKLAQCGSYLLFRHYLAVDEVRLMAADFCKKHLLCPLCAIRRGAKLVQAYLERLEVIGQYHPRVSAYLVTLTVKDGEELGERFDHLRQGMRKLLQARRSHLRGMRQVSESAKAIGGVGSYEFKRGRNSGLWHPHVHMVWLCYEAPDASALSAEWRRITGDSYIVDVRPFHDQEDVVSGFLEVFKYAVKFSDLPLADNWQGYLTLSRQRLVFSFREFFGVDVPDNLADELLPDEQRYVDLLFRYVAAAKNYRLEATPELLPGYRGRGAVSRPVP